MRTIIIIYILSKVAFAEDLSTHPIITLSDSSKIQGTIVSTINDGRVGQFLGIRYAQAPVGHLRFRPPLPALKNDQIFLANSFSDSCPQKTNDLSSHSVWIRENGIKISEDCLSLNIWTPGNEEASDKNDAVMVWIHGGGFFAGSTAEPIFDGRVLSHLGQVVVVTINYRLGVLGFLYADHAEAPGNVGLLDQSLALKWIHENIKSFGGDRQRITIFGESAGGLSVLFHSMASSPSGPYFQRVISQSPSAMVHRLIGINERSINRTISLADKVGCKTDKKIDWPSLLACLQSKTAEMLVNTFSQFEEKFMQLTWSPVIDGHFLNESIYDAFNSGHFKATDLIIGNTQNEAAPFLRCYYPKLFPWNYRLVEELSDQDFKQLIFSTVPSMYDSDKNILEKIYNNYKPNKAANLSNLEAAEKMASYALFFCDAQNIAQAYSSQKNKQKNVYNYIFKRKVIDNPKWAASPHATEIDFVFGVPMKEKKSI